MSLCSKASTEDLKDWGRSGMGGGVLGSDGLFWRIVPQADGRGEVHILTHKLQLDKAAQQPDGSAGDGQLTEVQHCHIPQDCVLDARVLEVLPKL